MNFFTKSYFKLSSSDHDGSESNDNDSETSQEQEESASAQKQKWRKRLYEDFKGETFKNKLYHNILIQFFKYFRAFGEG